MLCALSAPVEVTPSWLGGPQLLGELRVICNLDSISSDSSFCYTHDKSERDRWQSLIHV